MFTLCCFYLRDKHTWFHFARRFYIVYLKLLFHFMLFGVSQISQIIATQSTHGVSVSTICIASLTGVSAVLNVVLLDYYNLVACSGYMCFSIRYWLLFKCFFFSDALFRFYASFDFGAHDPLNITVLYMLYYIDEHATHELFVYLKDIWKSNEMLYFYISFQCLETYVCLIFSLFYKMCFL